MTKKHIVDAKYRELHRKERHARDAVRYAIKTGKLPRIEKVPCTECSDISVQWHHEDYDYPLWVTALCLPCHNDVHKDLGV